MTTDKKHSQARSNNEHSFDELAKGLARENLSRRAALKRIGGVLLGVMLTLIPGVEAFSKPPGTPPGQGGTPPGQGGTPPGLGGAPPGQGGTPPGQGSPPPPPPPL